MGISVYIYSHWYLYGGTGNIKWRALNRVTLKDSLFHSFSLAITSLSFLLIKMRLYVPERTLCASFVISIDVVLSKSLLKTLWSYSWVSVTWFWWRAEFRWRAGSEESNGRDEASPYFTRYGLYARRYFRWRIKDAR